MPRQVSFRPLAQSDVDEAVSWYGDERPVVALAFMEALDVIVARIREAPMQFPIVRGRIRRALLGMCSSLPPNVGSTSLPSSTSPESQARGRIESERGTAG